MISEDYTYDYAGNRTSKTVNELDVTNYVNDIHSDLTYVLSETDKDGKLKKSYTRGEELISSEIGTQSSSNNSTASDNTVRYFINDGHGSVRLLTDSEGNITDRYSYDGYGNLLEKEGDTENDYLYAGEQYNYTTELYYLRARYMDPSTGTFISMDSYAGTSDEPISLHKYLYANANPIMNTDPSGNTARLDEQTTASAGRVSVSSAVARHDQTVLIILNNLRNKLMTAETQMILTSAMATIISEYLLEEANALTIQNVDTEKKIKSYAVAYQKEDKKIWDVYTVYTLRDDNGIVRYVGRTKDYDRRMTAHARPGGKMQRYGLIPGERYDGLSWEECRALEQTLMVAYHSLNRTKDMGNLGVNFVNGISILNNNKIIYYNAFKDYYDKYPDYFENQIQNEISNILEDMDCWWD